jgi:hypothetical protein
MITSLQYIPTVGSTVTLNDLVYPVREFDVETLIDVRDYKKMAQPGEWSVYAYPGAMTIHCEGSILGTSSSDYVTKRLALLDAILPPIATLTSRIHGTVRIQMDGWTETADAEVIVTQQSIPMKANYPAISDFMITWKAFLPYFEGNTSSTKYQLG